MNKNSKTNVEVIFSSNPSQDAGLAISESLEKNSGNDVLFLIAGGSSLDVLNYVHEENINSQMTVCVTDERVSDELDINNYHQLQATPFWNVLIRNNAFSIPTELLGRDSKGLCEDFEKALKKWKSDFPKGLIMGLFGIGKDGHTAGIFSGIYSDEDFDNKYLGERLIEETDAASLKNTYPKRITATLSFMRDYVDRAFFFVQGQDKKQALQDTLSLDGDIRKNPARIMHDMKNVTVFTDIEI